MLQWPSDASPSDAILLAGVLKTNTKLTTLNLSNGASLTNASRSILGKALLQNKASRVGYCSDFGLTASVEACEFNLNRQELSDVGPFRLLAACLRGNRTLTSLTLHQLHPQLMETLAIALRGNRSLLKLTLISSIRTGGQTTATLPLPQLLGTWEAKTVKSFAWQNPSTVFKYIDEDGSGKWRARTIRKQQQVGR